MKKFQNKYRIPSARLQNWDYGANGAYFITICTDKMQHYFGEIFECEMQLNELGKLAQELWKEITNQFSYVELGNFVIMPNHIHGILIINKSATVETRFIASPNNEEKKGGVTGDKNPMLNENISRIIRWYKGRCSFEMRKIHADFSWHSRFHDHIIKDSTSFENIQNYIENNSSKWEEDKFYK
jgi:putative transposase